MGFIGEHQPDARERDANAPPGITLWQVLDIDQRCIPFGNAMGAGRIAWWWGECGRPAGKVALSVFLHHSINRCVKDGVRYPKIVLKRLKEMQRGEWEPRDYSAAAIMRRGGFQSAGEIMRGGSEDRAPTWDQIMR
jgi:hypothetical protein